MKTKMIIATFTFALSMMSIDANAFFCYEEMQIQKDTSGNQVVDDEGKPIWIKVAPKCCYRTSEKWFAPCTSESLNDPNKVSAYNYAYFYPLTRGKEISNPDTCSYNHSDPAVKNTFDDSLQKLIAFSLIMDDTKTADGKESDNHGLNKKLANIAKSYRQNKEKSDRQFQVIVNSLNQKYKALVEGLTLGDNVQTDSLTVSGLKLQADVFQALEDKEQTRFSNNKFFMKKISANSTELKMINRPEAFTNKCQPYVDCMVEFNNSNTCSSKYKDCVSKRMDYIKIKEDGSQQIGYLLDPNLPSFLRNKPLRSTSDLREHIEKYLLALKTQGGFEFEGTTQYTKDNSAKKPFQIIADHMISIWERWNFVTVSDVKNLHYLEKIKPHTSILNNYLKLPITHVQAFYKWTKDKNIRQNKIQCLTAKANKIGHQIKAVSANVQTKEEVAQKLGKKEEDIDRKVISNDIIADEKQRVQKYYESNKNRGRVNQQLK